MTQATHSRPDIVRGDTILAWQVGVTIDSLPADISEAKMQFRLGNRLVAEMQTSIAANIVTIEEFSATEAWPITVLDYDLELTLSDGRVVTWLKGTQKVLSEVTYD